MSGQPKYTKLRPIDPEFIRKNDGLVWWAIRRWCRGNMNAHIREDLVQEGRIGLMTAAQRFDPTKGVKFGTYAMPWIDATIQRAVRRSPIIKPYSKQTTGEAVSANFFRELDEKQDVFVEATQDECTRQDAERLWAELRPALICARMRRQVWCGRSEERAARDVDAYLARFNGETFDAIARRLGVTRARVAQICEGVHKLFEQFAREVREESAA